MADSIGRKCNSIQDLQEVHAALARNGVLTAGDTPEEFSALVAVEQTR